MFEDCSETLVLKLTPYESFVLGKILHSDSLKSFDRPEEESAVRCNLDTRLEEERRHYRNKVTRLKDQESMTRRLNALNGYLEKNPTSDIS